MSTIREAINKCDASNEMEAVIKEQLETLIELAEYNTELQLSKITNSLKDGKISDDLYVPISKIVEQYTDARAVTTESNADIVGNIKTAISKFFHPGKEEILDGVSDIIGTAFDALMGSGEGMEFQKTIYIVAVEYPSVVRMDVAAWVRNTRAQGIRDKCKSAIAVVAVKSAVDITKLDFATFVSVYAPLLSKCYSSDLKNVDELLDSAENIYKRLGLQTKPQGLQAIKPYSLEKLQRTTISMVPQVGDF